MGKISRPAYDGNACMLYDYMKFHDLTEEMVAERMKLERYPDDKAPWQPVQHWIQDPYSIPIWYVPVLCSVLHAPADALFARSRMLNGEPFSGCGVLVRIDVQKLEDLSTDDLLMELRRRVTAGKGLAG